MSDDEPRSGGVTSRGRAGWWLVVAVVVLAPALRYLAGDIGAFYVSNADMLAVPSFVETVRMHGLDAFGHWYWPPAPYFVVDFLLYVPLWLAIPDPHVAPASFMVLQLALLVASLRYLGQQLAADRPSAGRWGSLLSFAVLVGLASLLVDPARFVLASYYRAGTFILSVVAVAAVLAWVRQRRVPRRPAVLVAAGALVGATVWSDPLFVPATVVPLLLLIVMLAAVPASRGGWRDQRRAVGLLVVTTGAATAGGMLANRWMVTDETSYGPALTGRSTRAQLDGMIDIATGTDLRLTLLTLASLVLLGAAVVREWLAGRPRVTPLAVVAAFWSISLVGHVGAMAIDTAEPTIRYVQLPYLLPIAVAGVLLARMAWDRPHGRAAVGVALAAAGLVSLVPAVDVLGDVDLEAQQEVAECLDDALPGDAEMDGVSGYWEARVLQLDSEHDPEVAVLDGVGYPYRINASSTWFDGPWSFAVVNRTTTGWDPPTELIGRYAPDATVTECSSYLVYRFASAVDSSPMDRPGDEVALSGCDLGSTIGDLDEERCVVEVPAEAGYGFGTFGGKTPLEPGRHEVQITYRTPVGSEPTAIAGVADVLRIRGIGPDDLDVVVQEDLTGTDGDWRTIRFSVDVPDDGLPFVLEARTVAYGELGYEVRSVRITNRSGGHP